MKQLYAIVLILLVGYSNSGFAQRYPATSSIQLIPPYSVNLEDYTLPGYDRLLISAVFNDFSQPGWDVKFKITIKGNGIQLQTNPDRIITPIRLSAGQMEQFSGSDLPEYFNYNNMNINGISLSQLQLKGGLPEGAYTFAVEILDYNSGIPISNKAVTTAMLMLNDPPQISLPAPGSRITDIETQNINFQWLPMHHGSPNSTFTTQYELIVVEVPQGLNPNEAIRSSLPIFQTETNSTSFQYDISAPLLEEGKTYAYRIKATDSENLGLFKNEGYSDVSWFTYGYNRDGKIALQSPVDESVVKSDNRLIFSWQAPNNLDDNQMVGYKFTMVSLDGGLNKFDAISGNPAYYEETIPESLASSGWSFQLPIELQTESKYAWQVTAYTGETEIAISDVRIVNSSPKINQFNAGQHIVKVTSLENENFDDFSGTGLIQITADGVEHEVTFSHLKLTMLAGKPFLKEGRIANPLNDEFLPISLGASYEANGNSTFYADSLYLDKNNLKISGHVEWPLPFPVTSGNQAFVKSQNEQIKYDNYRLNGIIQLAKDNQFQLMEPYGFDLALLEGSTFFIKENVYTENFNAEIELPKEIITKNGQKAKVKLQKVQQLFYHEIATTNQPLFPIKNLNISIVPSKMHLDFSTVGSPGKFSADPFWTGLYVDEFEVKYDTKIDDQQLQLTNEITYSYVLEDSEFNAWIDGQGLDFKIEQSFKDQDNDFSSFNQFRGKIFNITCEVEDNAVLAGVVNGNIQIPFLKENYYEYTIPVSQEGFEEGYLVEDLTGKQFTMREGKDDEVTFTILQSIFEGHDHLDMALKMDWPGVDVAIEQVRDFKIWGNGNIGFETANGDQPLATQIPGKLRIYPITATKVGAGLSGENYYLKLTSDIVIDEEISGKNGVPSIDLYSLYKSISIPKDEISVKFSTKNNNAFDAGKMVGANLTTDSMYIHMKTPLASLSGYVSFKENDVDWGDSFHGILDFEAFIPAPFRSKAAVVIGKRDGFSYSFFEVGRGIDVENKTKSKNAGAGAGARRDGSSKATKKFKVAGEKYNRGLMTIGSLTITGMDLRYYKRMSHTDPSAVSESGTDDIPITFQPDPNNNYGIYGRVAARDKETGGEAFTFDLAFEYSESNNKVGFDQAIKSRYAFEGNLKIGARNSSDKSKNSDALGSGYGKLIYDEAENHLLGDFWVSIEKPKVLCAEGGLAFSIKPNFWNVSLGSEDRLIKATPFCFGKSYAGYLNFNPNEFELGLGMGYELRLRSPEISFAGNDFTVTLDAGYTAGLKTGIRVRPEFAIQKVGIWIDMWAALAVEYDTWFDSGVWEIASASLTGNATVHFEPRKRLNGSLNGSVEVLGFDVDFKMNIDQSF